MKVLCNEWGHLWPHCTYIAPSYPSVTTSSGAFLEKQHCAVCGIDTTKGTRGSSHRWIRGGYVYAVWSEMTPFITFWVNCDFKARSEAQICDNSQWHPKTPSRMYCVDQRDRDREPILKVVRSYCVDQRDRDSRYQIWPLSKSVPCPCPSGLHNTPIPDPYNLPLGCCFQFSDLSAMRLVYRYAI